MGDGSLHAATRHAAHPGAGEQLPHDDQHLSLYDDREPNAAAEAAAGTGAEDSGVTRGLLRQASSRRRRAVLVDGLDKKLSGSAHHHSKRQQLQQGTMVHDPSTERLPASAPVDVPQAALMPPPQQQQQRRHSAAHHPPAVEQQQGSAAGAAAAPMSAPPQQRRHRRTRSLPPCPRSPFADPDVQCQVVVPEPVRASQRAALTSFHATKATKATKAASPPPAPKAPPAPQQQPVLVLQDSHARTSVRSVNGSSFFRKLRPDPHPHPHHHHASSTSQAHPAPAPPTKAVGATTTRAWATQPRGAGGAALVQQMSAFTAAVQARLWQQQLEEEAADLNHALLAPRRAHATSKAPRSSPSKAGAGVAGGKGDAKLKGTSVVVASATGWRTSAGGHVVPCAATGGGAGAGVKWSPSSDADLSKGLSDDQMSQAGGPHTDHKAGVSWWRALLRCGCPAPPRT